MWKWAKPSSCLETALPATWQLGQLLRVLLRLLLRLRALAAAGAKSTGCYFDVAA